MPPPHRPPPRPTHPPTHSPSLPLGTKKILSVCTTALHADCFGVKTEYGTPKRSVAEFIPRPRLSTARRNDQQSSPDPVNITDGTTAEAAAAPLPSSSSPSPHPPPKRLSCRCCRTASSSSHSNSQLPVSVCLSVLSVWLAGSAGTRGMHPQVLPGGVINILCSRPINSSAPLR